MGARGSVGRLVLDDLVRRGLPVRASSRRPGPGSGSGGVDVMTADLTDPASLRPAFDGMRQVFLYATPVGVSGVVEAARSAGVRRIVLMSSGSVVHPSSAGNAITEEHRAVEDAFGSAPDLELVPVRPLVLASNALGWARSVRGGASGPALPARRPHGAGPRARRRCGRGRGAPRRRRRQRHADRSRAAEPASAGGGGRRRDRRGARGRRARP
ncbi:SDR family oxidoreductase [Microlunatus antarcticus]|uniref:SDR family oxidoreductase n=1 Tax=Microlunatus antarcticus TaxID=53388 RepID=UPI0038CC1B0F